jgi:hypothetical protein
VRCTFYNFRQFIYYKYFGALHLPMTESEQRVIPSRYLSGAAKRNEESVVKNFDTLRFTHYET